MYRKKITSSGQNVFATSYRATQCAFPHTQNKKQSEISSNNKCTHNNQQNHKKPIQ